MAKSKKGGKKSSPKTHMVKSPSGKTPVSSKSVSDARSGKGVFKQRPSYKGKETKGGVTTHDGTFHRVTGPVSRRAARKILAKDKALHGADSRSQSDRINRFATARKRGK